MYTILNNMWSEIALPALPWPQGDVPPSALLFLSSFSLVPNLLFIPGVWDRNRFASIAQKYASLVWPPALQKYPTLSQALVLWPRLGSPKMRTICTPLTAFHSPGLWASPSKPCSFTSQLYPFFSSKLLLKIRTIGINAS